MIIPRGYIIFLLAYVLFIIFSILQIRKGKEDIKNLRGPEWISRLRILFAVVFLIASVLLTIFVITAILNYIGQK
jgi:hypothetical protein